MKHWQFMDYYSETGHNYMHDWYARQIQEVQADFDVIVNILSATRDWSGRKDCQALKKRHLGLWEIRFTVKNVRYRPVGFFGPDGGKFTLLLGCIKHKRGLYTPNNAFDIALELKRKFLEERKGYIYEH